MAIHVEHVGVLERAREVSRLEDIITEDNEDIEAEMPKMGDDPAGKEARFLQATDEMSAALTQFMKKKIYEEQLANFLDGEEYVLEDQPIEKTDKVMEALKAATTHDYEVYSFAKKLFPDESDLVVVLRAILRKKQISENVRLNAEALLRKVNQATQVIEVAGQPIHAVHHHCIAFADEAQQRFELGALGVLARCLVGEHLAHLGLFQLAFRVLVKAADPDVADAVPLHDVSLVEGGLSALSVPLCLKAHFCQAEIYNLRGHVSKNGKADSILTKRRGPA